MYSHEVIPGDQYSDFFRSTEWIVGLCNYLGKFDEAFNLLQAAEMLFQLPDVKQVDKHAILLKHVQIKILRFFLVNTNYEQTLEFAQNVYQEAQIAWNATGMALDTRDALDIVNASCFLGLTHYFHELNTGNSNYTRAQSCFQQALEVCEKLVEERKMTLAPFFNSSATQHENDAYDYALDYFTRKIDRVTSKTLFCMGLISERSEAFAQAQDFYQRSLDLALRSDAQEIASLASSRLANISSHKWSNYNRRTRSIYAKRSG